MDKVIRRSLILQVQNDPERDSVGLCELSDIDSGVYKKLQNATFVGFPGHKTVAKGCILMKEA